MKLPRALAAALLLGAAACGGDDQTATTGTTATTAAVESESVLTTPPVSEPATTAAPPENVPPDDWKSSPTVWAAIQALTDCAELQAMFDTAADNHDRESDRGNSAGAEATLQIMEAADERMQEVDCS